MPENLFFTSLLVFVVSFVIGHLTVETHGKQAPVAIVATHAIAYSFIVMVLSAIWWIWT